LKDAEGEPYPTAEEMRALFDACGWKVPPPK
jgi:hypothetical protein